MINMRGCVVALVGSLVLIIGKERSKAIVKFIDDI